MPTQRRPATSVPPPHTVATGQRHDDPPSPYAGSIGTRARLAARPLALSALGVLGAGAVIFLVALTPWRVSNPGTVMVVSVVFAAFMAGTRVGLIAVAFSEAVLGIYVTTFGTATEEALSGTKVSVQLVTYAASASAIAVIVGTLRRRSERRVEEQRRESERMAALEQVKSHFLNVASHELRGPLSIARGYASMLADGTFGPPEASDIRRAVPILMSKLEEMNALVDSMLDTARLEERRLVLRLSPVDVRILIDRAMVSVQPSLSAKHELNWRRPPRPVMVMADEARLSIIITNVLHNAVKYSPDGGGIDCFLSVDRGEMLLTVWDHGLGIAEKDLPRLFTRFGRIVTRENSHILGTGLGLYLARELALLHGGDLKVASSYGHGSAFTLIMPLLSDADMADATDAAAAGEPPARSRAPRAKRRATARV